MNISAGGIGHMRLKGGRRGSGLERSSGPCCVDSVLILLGFYSQGRREGGRAGGRKAKLARDVRVTLPGSASWFTS